MPYRTEWKPHGIIWEFYGDVTAREIEAANAEFYGDARSDSAKHQIIDAGRVTSVEWNEIDISKTAGYDIGADRSVKNLRVAYVADDAEIISKLEKYIEISRNMNSSWQFKGFRDVAAARAWAETGRQHGE